MRRRPVEAARVRAAAICVLAVATAAPASASAAGRIYWANEAGNTIGRANLDGSRVEQRFIVGATEPRAVAIDAARLYWAQGDEAGTIGRANLDGSGVEQAFVAAGVSPTGVAVGAGFLYWTHTVPSAGAAAFAPRHDFPAPRAGGNVGRVRLDGSAANGRFVYAGRSPCGVAVDSDKVYWGNGGAGAIARSHGPFEAEPRFIRGASDPCGVAVTGRYLYWANRDGNSIGRARVDGTGVQQRFIETRSPCGVAVDGAYVYWTTGRGTSGRARLNGGAVDQRFIVGARGPCGIAVSPTARPQPATVRFRAAAPGRRSAIAAIVVENTSSSALDVSAVRIAGRDARDFVVTGDGCTVNLIPPGGACVVNARFTPAAAGARRARLKVVSNASNSPTTVRLAGETRAPRREPNR